LLGSGLVAGPSFAQSSASRPVVAILVAGSSTNVSRDVLNGFSEGMQELGYFERRDFEIVYRYADNDLARIPELAKEPTQLKPTVFVTSTVAGTFAIRDATAAIPIANPALSDPVSFGFVQSQARPGGQVTGIMATLDSLLGKQLELVRELVPGATRIGMLVNASNRGNVFHLKAAKAASIALGLTLVPIDVRLPEDIDDAFRTLAQGRAELLLIIPEALFLNERKRIVELAAAARLPTMYSWREATLEGGVDELWHQHWRELATRRSVCGQNIEES